jgi:hypothetical protein
MLYLAMLRAAGLTAYPISVADREERFFDPSYMNFDQLDTTLVSLISGGKQTTLDPGEKMCPFGVVSWRHSYASGIGESSQGLSLVTTPELSYVANTVTRTAIVTVDEHGGVTGSATIVMIGQEALRWRQLALENDMAEVKKRFDRELEDVVPDGVEAHVDHFLGIDEPESNLVAMVNLQGSVGTVTARRLLLPGFFFETRARVPFVDQEKRLEPVDMRYGNRVTDQVTYLLPAGMTVEGAPPDANISWAGHSLFIVKSQSDAGKLTVAHSVARAFTLVKAEDYQDLRGFYQKVAAADQDQIVLTAASTEKGN